MLDYFLYYYVIILLFYYYFNYLIADVSIIYTYFIRLTILIYYFYLIIKMIYESWITCYLFCTYTYLFLYFCLDLHAKCVIWLFINLSTNIRSYIG